MPSAAALRPELSQRAADAKNKAVKILRSFVLSSALVLSLLGPWVASDTAAQMGGAAAAEPQPWAPAFLDRDQLISLALTRDFTTLDALIAEPQSRLETNHLRSDEDVVVHALDTFSFSKPGLADAVAAWVKAMPESPFARTALGIALAAEARRVHGPLLKALTDEESIRAWRGHFKPAEDSLREALRLRHKLSAASSQLIALLMQSRRFAEGQLENDRAVGADSRIYEPRFQLAYHLQPQWMGSFGAMNAIAGSAFPFFRVNPGMSALNGLPGFSRGYSRFFRGEFELADRELRSAVLYGPDRRFETVFGRNLAGLGLHAEAEATLRRALALWPDEPSSLIFLAEQLTRSGRADEALRLAQRAQDLDPEGYEVEQTFTLPSAVAVLARCNEVEGLARIVEACANRGNCDSEQRARVVAMLGSLRSWQLCPQSFQDSRLRQTFWVASQLGE